MPFHEQTLSAVLVDNVPYVAMKPICENIGLDWDAQRQRIKRHPISKGTVMITTPSNGGIQEMLMLPIKMLNSWLFGVDSNRVKPEIKSRVIEYQEECFDVLADHFMPKQPVLTSLPFKKTKPPSKAVCPLKPKTKSSNSSKTAPPRSRAKNKPALSSRCGAH